MRHETRTFQTKAAKINRRGSEKSGRQSPKLRAVSIFLGGETFAFVRPPCSIQTEAEDLVLRNPK